MREAISFVEFVQLLIINLNQAMMNDRVVTHSFSNYDYVIVLTDKIPVDLLDHR